MNEVGLCISCRHARRITSRKGTTYWYCGRAELDPSFPKYPALPVLYCRGYEPSDSDDAAGQGVIISP